MSPGNTFGWALEKRKVLNELVLRARCERCLGRGITGHMAIGHDACSACGGKGEKPGHGFNLIAALSDALWLDAEAQIAWRDARERQILTAATEGAQPASPPDHQECG